MGIYAMDLKVDKEDSTIPPWIVRSNRMLRSTCFVTRLHTGDKPYETSKTRNGFVHFQKSYLIKIDVEETK